MSITHFDELEDLEYPVTGFGISYAGELCYCEVLMKEHCYDIYLDGKFAGSITMNINFTWILCGGSILPDQLVNHIGRKIENAYM